MKIKNRHVPLSTIAEERIIEYINVNEIQVDEKLPTELNLIELLGVSRHTIREALAVLTEKKIIYKIQGTGTFLKQKPIEISSGLEKLESVTESIESFGYVAGTKWISIEQELPTEIMAKKLKIEMDEVVTTFKRIRMADDKMAAFCIDSIPSYKIKSEVSIEIGNKSLLSIIEENGNLITSSRTEIIPSFPTEEMIRLLGVDKDHLFTLLYQIHFDREGSPVTYSLDYFDPEVFRFEINRQR